MTFERYRKRIGEEGAKQQDESMKDLCDSFSKIDLNRPVMQFDEHKRKVEEAYGILRRT